MAHKTGMVTVIGRPNVGKSTLINALVGEKIAITSPRPQTTRNNMRAILSTEDYQLIFIDTPGIHSPKNKLGEMMTEAARKTLSEVDVILYICDSTDRTLLSADRRIIELIRQAAKPTVLLLNKIDAIPKEALLERISTLSGEYDFAEIIPVSALKKDGLDIVIDALVKLIPEGPALYDEEYVTDTSVRDIASEIIREKVLLYTKDEVPHGTGVEIVRFIEGEARQATHIDATIYCEKDSHKAIILGKGGAMLGKIGTAARRDIEKLIGGPADLKLWVKVRENWRNNNGFLHDQGFGGD
ncbi:MAG: GTPase Era [Clostridia bacterium]|nr:GTPase Era [Clostridia bacterium]MBQ3867099.1 GTPase Era [Clostridia bacterium]MBR0158752.1 GTPase Era [Clostridia bacterium]